jgi:sec-independent protein translocase protein TatB
MFEVGFTELLVIFVLALIVLGPEKLPRLAAQVGRWIGRARAMAKQFRDQLEDEVNLADMNKWQQQQKQQEASKPADPPPPESTAADSTATDSGSAESSPSGGTSSTPTAADPYSSPSQAAATENSPPADDPPRAYTTNALGGTEHEYSGPAPEPEASVYHPPAYANANGTSSSETAAHAVNSAPDSEPSHPSPEYDTGDDKPARPGDVITTTHERGP